MTPTPKPESGGAVEEARRTVERRADALIREARRGKTPLAEIHHRLMSLIDVERADAEREAIGSLAVRAEIGRCVEQATRPYRMVIEQFLHSFDENVQEAVDEAIKAMRALWTGEMERKLMVRVQTNPAPPEKGVPMNKSAEALHPLLDPRLSRFIVVAPSSCWIWGGVRNRGGYGRVWNGSRQVAAHRMTYEMVKGPIPPGLCIDHLCRTPPCVNPDHLEAVTIRENVLRGIGPAAENAKKTRCPKGHEYGPATDYPSTGPIRDCLVCKSEKKKARREHYRERLNAWRSTLPQEYKKAAWLRARQRQKARATEALARLREECERLARG